MPRVHKTAAYTSKASSRRLFISLVMIVGLLIPLIPGTAALAAEEAETESSSAESVGAKTLEDLKNKDLDKVVPSVDTAATQPSSPAPGDPAEILPVPPADPDWKPGQELLERRTATSKAFTGRTPGEIETRLYAEPINYQEGDRWVPIDAGLTTAPDGDHQNKANDFDLELAKTSDDPKLGMLALDESHSVGFGLDQAARVEGKRAKNVVTYSKVRKDTDVRLTSTKTGVKEELILASPQAPTRFLFPLKLKGLTAAINEAGDVVYIDSEGNERARTPHGYMFDSNIDPLADEPAMSNGVTYALVPHGQGPALEVTLDENWVNSPDRVWPLIVDPEVHRVTWGDDTYVMSPFSTNYSSDVELKVGSWNGGANKARSFMHFDTGSLPGTVTSAELQMRELHSYDCAAPPEAIFRITQGWVGSTTSTFPGLSYDPSGTLGAWVNGSCPNRLATWNVTGMVQHFQNIGETMGSFAAVATRETTNSVWKKYRSSEAGDGPLLKVWTNQPPVTPWAVTPVNNQRVFTSAVPVSAAYADADGTPGYVGFGVWNSAGTLMWAHWSGLQNNYTIASATTPALADGWYRVASAAFDGQLYSNPLWSADQWFRVDTQRPQLSLVTPTAGSTVGPTFGVSARYTEPYGYGGEVLFAVNRLDGTGVTSAWSQPVSQGQTATANLTISQPGQYDFYAIGNDGNRDANAYGAAWSGPYRITVGGAPGAPTSINASAAPTAALIKWTDGPNNSSPASRYDFVAYNATNAQAAPVQKSCTTACSPSNGFLVDSLIPGNAYTIKMTATNAYGTSLQSAASNSMTPEGWSGYSVTATTPARGDTSVRVDWTAQTLTLKYVVKAYVGTRPANGLAAGTPVSQVDALGGVTTANVGAPNSTPLMNGTPHYFTVTPYFLGILPGPESEASNDVIPAGAPFEPEEAVMFPGDQGAHLVWSPPEDRDGTPGNNGSPITNYNVEIFPVGETEPVKSVTVAADQTTVEVAGLANGVVYEARVNAENDAKPTPGPNSEASNRARPAGAPFSPRDIGTSVIDEGTVRVFWNSPTQGPQGFPGDNGARISSYRIIPSPACPACKGLEVGGRDSSAVVDGLAPATSYTFTVAAANRRGEGVPSSPSEATIPQLSVPVEPDPGSPQTPVLNGVTLDVAPRVRSESNKPPANVTAKVEWAAWDRQTPPPDHYRVIAEVDALNGTGNQIVDSGLLPSFATEVTLSGLNAHWSYDFRVVASNDSGASDPAHSGSVKSLLGELDDFMEMDLPDFQNTLDNDPQEPFQWDTDGCSIVLDAYSPTIHDLESSCRRHDFGYHNYGHRVGIYQETPGIIEEIDDNFLADMRFQCSTISNGLSRSGCFTAARGAWFGVRNLSSGSTYYAD